MGNSNYNISIQPGYVLIERPRNYEVVPNEQPAMLMEMSAICKKAGCRKVLILGPKTKVKLAAFDIYDLGKEIANSKLQIAIVESHDASNDDVHFLETVAINRGGPIRFFNNEKKARNWLGIS